MPLTFVIRNVRWRLSRGFGKIAANASSKSKTSPDTTSSPMVIERQRIGN